MDRGLCVHCDASTLTQRYIPPRISFSFLLKISSSRQASRSRCGLSAIMNGKIARNIERPRPLRSKSKSDSVSTDDSSGDVEGVHQLLLNVSSMLDSSEFGGSLPEAIGVLNKALKVHGAKLEKSFGSGLNQPMGSLMTSVRDATLDMASKLYLLEIIELRKNKWVADGNIADYYRQKLATLEVRKQCIQYVAYATRVD